jgi:hypothetical protein
MAKGCQYKAYSEFDASEMDTPFEGMRYPLVMDTARAPIELDDGDDEVLCKLPVKLNISD